MLARTSVSPLLWVSCHTPMIEVEAVSKRFGKTQALAAVDLTAEQGKVLALLGPNGAGKTTLVRDPDDIAPP